jgi:probable rRNA maturation factor
MDPDGSTILFRVPARGIRRRNLLAFARQLESELASGRPFCCLISGDADLRRLNRQFRKKDYATDVLSFPASDAQTEHLGELAISIDRARAQAADLGHSVDEELRILMLHGVLHLTGMDHERDKGRMARAETRWRKRLGLPAGLIERAS